MVDKYKNKNGDIAVLISHGYGAGWSTWNSQYAEDMLFDKDIVEVIVNNPIRNIDSYYLRSEDLKLVEEIAKAKYPKAYLGGLHDHLAVEWLKPGTNFRVHEYDGSETIMTQKDIEIHCA